MNSPETLDATKTSLAQDWLNALRYWLRGRNGVIALVVLAAMIGGALNWSWLVAIGIAPLLLAVLPCAAMCALGLCMHKIGQGSCSTGTRPVGTPKPAARVTTSLDAGEPASLQSDRSALPEEPSASPAIPVTERECEEREPR